MSTPHDDVSELLRNTAFAYWEAWNDFDADRALAFLEPSYRSIEDGEIRRDIDRARRFRARLRISEDSPPVPLGSGQWEMFLIMRTPIDTRRIRMTFLPEGDRCWITFSGEAA